MRNRCFLLLFNLLSHTHQHESSQTRSSSRGRVCGLLWIHSRIIDVREVWQMLINSLQWPLVVGVIFRFYLPFYIAWIVLISRLCFATFSKKIK